MNKQTLVQIPANVDDKSVLKRILATIVENLDTINGLRGSAKYATVDQIILPEVLPAAESVPAPTPPTSFDSSQDELSPEVMGAVITSMTAKVVLVDADTALVSDSADSGKAKKTTLTNIWTWISGHAGTLAATAAKAVQLATARTINGVNFDGTADIVVVDQQWQYESGNYYCGICASADTTNAAGVGVLRGYFFIVSKQTTFDRIGCEITTNYVGGTTRLGIYNTTNGRPSSLLLDAGTVTTSAVATVEIVISQVLLPGVYYLVSVPQSGSTATLRGRTITNVTFSIPLSNGTTLAAGASTGFSVSGVTGALPSSPTWVANTAATVNKIMLRAA